MKRRVYILMVLAIVGMVSSSCFRSFNRQMQERYAQQEASFTPSDGDEVDFIMAKSFCLDDDTSLFQFKTKGPIVKRFELLNRWGQTVIVTSDPDFIPSKVFPIPPAEMAEMGQMNWRLTYLNREGQEQKFNGQLYYMGAKCKK
jgi:hypothetical protein